MTKRIKVGQTKGPARLSIEAALQKATVPLSAREISELTGVSLVLTRAHLGNCVHQRLAYNVHPRECPPGAYLWGQPDAVPAQSVAPSRTIPVSGTYTGEARSYVRPEGQAAFLIPSVGQAERKRPIIIGSRA